MRARYRKILYIRRTCDVRWKPFVQNSQHIRLHLLVKYFNLWHTICMYKYRSTVDTWAKYGNNGTSCCRHCAFHSKLYPSSYPVVYLYLYIQLYIAHRYCLRKLEIYGSVKMLLALVADSFYGPLSIVPFTIPLCILSTHTFPPQLCRSVFIN